MIKVEAKTLKEIKGRSFLPKYLTDFLSVKPKNCKIMLELPSIPEYGKPIIRAIIFDESSMMIVDVVEMEISKIQRAKFIRSNKITL